MTIVKALDALTEWAQENICNEIMLKVPPPNLEANDSGYDYTLAHPTAYTMFLPTGDKLPKGIISEYPGLVVSPIKTQDDLVRKTCRIDVQLMFCVWDPGQHSEDLFLPNKDGTYRRQKLGAAKFIRNGNGWRDAWNFMDIARRKIESITAPAGLCLDKSMPVECGPLVEQDAVPNYYPFWYTVMNFRVTFPLMWNNEEIQNFL